MLKINNNHFSIISLHIFEFSPVASSVDPHEMMHHAAFLMGLHSLPKYIFICEKWCEARNINP